MGRASKIGSVVYKALPVEFRKFWMYRSFTGEALKMLRDGMMEEEVTKKLMEMYVIKEAEKTTEHTINKKERAGNVAKIGFATILVRHQQLSRSRAMAPPHKYITVSVSPPCFTESS
jgi:hypothetical protein